MTAEGCCTHGNNARRINVCRACHDAALARAAASEERARRAEQALAPFAALGRAMVVGGERCYSLTAGAWGFNEARITFGDCYRAEDVLCPPPAATETPEGASHE